jgi:hypothetical protein
MSMQAVLIFLVVYFISVGLVLLLSYFAVKRDKNDSKERFTPETDLETCIREVTTVPKPMSKTGDVFKSDTVTINFDLPDGFTSKASVIKVKQGKKTVYGCSLCLDKFYKHKSSANKHIRAKHK